MEKNKALNDLQEIKSMMERSTRFISLSGMSGILAGIYALIGSIYVHFLVTEPYELVTTRGFIRYFENPLFDNLSVHLITVAIIVLLLAVVTAFFLTKQKASKHKQSMWNAQSIRLVLNFLAPLSIGGIFTLVLLQYGLMGLVAPAMLIFYGLACMNAAKYTIGTVKYLGITCAILGLINTQFIGLGLYFWAVGFGVCHIIYGAVMYYKYDR